MDSNTFPAKTAAGETVQIVEKYHGDNQDEIICKDDQGNEYYVRSASGEPLLYPRYEAGLEPQAPPAKDTSGDPEALEAAEKAAAEALQAELDAAEATTEASDEATVEKKDGEDAGE